MKNHGLEDVGPTGSAPGGVLPRALCALTPWFADVGALALGSPHATSRKMRDAAMVASCCAPPPARFDFPMI